MKVIYHKDFNQTYCSDPAAAPGRIGAIVKAIRDKVTFLMQFLLGRRTLPPATHPRI